MPELPEVETVCRGLDPVMKGQVIADVVLHREGLRQPFPPSLKKALQNKRVQAVSRRAKYILIDIDGGKTLVIHLGMSGRVQIESAGYKAQKHDHMILHMKNDRVIVLNDPRRFGVVLLLDRESLNDHPAFSNLGPEPLSNDFTAVFLESRLRNKKTPIKVAIMDQRIVVGVGNIYACEALAIAGINPERLAGSITGDRAVRLVKAIRDVLRKAIRKGGSTLRDHRRVDGELGYFQRHFQVYDREGRACPGCTCDIVKTGGIRRIVQGGRSSFYCPRTQR